MTETSDTICRVLGAWVALEVLTPQVARPSWGALAAERGGRQRNKGTAAPDGPAYWEVPSDGDPTPWPQRPDPLPEPDGGADTPRRWYVAVLGALPAKPAYEALDGAFGDAADEDRVVRRAEGSILAATVVLDEWGIALPDTLAIASFAWGLGLVLASGSAAELPGWGEAEASLKARFGGILAPTGADGMPRSLTWRDLRAASLELAAELRLPLALWEAVPCTVEVVAARAPGADLLSSFLLPDLARVMRGVDGLPDAAAAYLGLRPPAAPWDALDEAERGRLAELLRPELFPLGRWPGPGLHPLTLLQQAAVNAVVRDLSEGGLAAVNGPPGTGKTTLLRDLVADVMVRRAERLAALDDPGGDLRGLDLMDFAIVVASSNNAAVENISLELPVRGRALDASVWRDGGLDLFGPTATAVLGVAQDAPEEERAWGLMAARLGNAGNRRTFFERFWWDRDWGLRDWLDQAAWPNARRDGPPGALTLLDPPPRKPEAMAAWRAARDEFRQALACSRALRDGLAALDQAGQRLREVEAALPAAVERMEVAGKDLASAARAAAAARGDAADGDAQVALEAGKLSALGAVAPSWFARVFKTRAWRLHEAGVREQVARLGRVQDAGRDAAARREAAEAEERRILAVHGAAVQARDELAAETARLGQVLNRGDAAAGGMVPGPGFWSQPADALHRTSPWNGGAFRDARDAVFVAAVRLHRAFIAAAAKQLKPALSAVCAGGARGEPTAADWGAFFLVVPVVSTTFASVGRMFRGFGAGEIGWLLVDEAGQATPQAAVGAVWRARRAVVIGDPLQIEPVATTPERTTGLVFASVGADPGRWAAPGQSAQTLADRASSMQGRFRIRDGVAGAKWRVTGMPLLVHRRCDSVMFGIANRIAYDGRMVHATPAGASGVRDLLGPSAWVDVDAPGSDKWVEMEGRLIAAVLVRLFGALREAPDVYVICPFKLPALRLRSLLLATPGVLPGQTAEARRRWIGRRVGTVHTFQGKEAEAVILMLGAGRGARPGSRAWAGGRPNLLNVAATRARRVLYLVGNRAEWMGAGVFADPARELPVVSGQAWLAKAASASGPISHGSDERWGLASGRTGL